MQKFKGELVCKTRAHDETENAVRRRWTSIDNIRLGINISHSIFAGDRAQEIAS